MSAPEWMGDPAVEEALYKALPDHARATLKDAARLTATPSRRWMRVPSWRQFLCTVAVGWLIEREEARGASGAEAVRIVSARLGIPADTLASWLSRPRRYALD